MTDEYGLTVQCLAKPKGSLTMMDDSELPPLVWAAISHAAIIPGNTIADIAIAAIAAVRAYDAHQRAKVPSHDPDSDRECPASLVSSRRPTGGLTEFKRD